MAQLVKDLVGIEVKPKYRGQNSYGIQTSKKEITSFFLENGFNSESKVYTVKIPDYIKSAEISVKCAFLRGLFDTDGCIYFDKNKTPFNHYPRVQFSFASRFLRDDLRVLLDDLGFRNHIWDSVRKDGMEFKIACNGFNNLDRWTKEVSPANNKHLLRIKIGLSNRRRTNVKNSRTNV